VAAWIAVLQASLQNGVECGAGNNPKLPSEGHGPRKSPIGNARAHAALDKYRMLNHAVIVAGIYVKLSHTFVLPAGEALRGQLRVLALRSGFYHRLPPITLPFRNGDAEVWRDLQSATKPPKHPARAKNTGTENSLLPD
jgi:hypothetical protein